MTNKEINDLYNIKSNNTNNLTDKYKSISTIIDKKIYQNNLVKKGLFEGVIVNKNIFNSSYESLDKKSKFIKHKAPQHKQSTPKVNIEQLTKQEANQRLHLLKHQIVKQSVYVKKLQDTTDPKVSKEVLDKEGKDLQQLEEQASLLFAHILSLDGHRHNKDGKPSIARELEL